MSKYILPDKLTKGDIIILVTPSGAVDPEFVEKAKIVLEEWGLRVQIAPHALGKNGRYCGTGEERLLDLQQAMDDKKTKAVLCTRGGYGIVQLLDKLDFAGIKKYPKWIIGYSDITALHAACSRNGLISLHAPMARHIAEDLSSSATNYLQKTLFEKKPSYTCNAHALNRIGKASGRLIGGNLSVFCGLLGTPFLKIPRGSILFIEDIGEKPYQIDRMMWHLKLSGVFERISGLIVGQFTDYEEDLAMYASVYESMRKMVNDYDFPVCFNFPVGHVVENFPLLYGNDSQLEVKDCEVVLNQ